jgi:hypothetical protein
VAIDVAEACELRGLQLDLVEIALNPFELLPIRVDAAQAVVRIGDGGVKVRLKPLASGKAGDDPDDELKSCGLRAVWPDQMTVEELFACLTSPKNENLLGGYWTFLSRDLAQHLEGSNLPTALEWVASQHRREHLHPFEKLADSILLRALEHLEAPRVVKAFAKAALSRLKDHHEIFREQSEPQFQNVLENEETKRHQILEVMLCCIHSQRPRKIFLSFFMLVRSWF